MTIKYAILGFLSWKSLSGYDLKKMFESSISFYWSGNNNQIYTTLNKLKKEGSVSMEILPQDSLPNKKLYTITGQGQEELKSWVMSVPELPKLKHAFLIQLAWSDMLSAGELKDLCSAYEQEIQKRLGELRSDDQAKNVSLGRTDREKHIWNMILKNGIDFYKNELNWIRELMAGL